MSKKSISILGDSKILTEALAASFTKLDPRVQVRNPVMFVVFVGSILTPVIRESGGDRSSVTGGTKVVSDWIIVRVTTMPGESFLDRMIAMVEGAKRQKTPNEIALAILLAGFTIIFLLVTATLLPFSLYA